MCNAGVLRSDEHDLAYLPPVVRELRPDETESEFAAGMNMYEQDVLTRELENSAFRESHEREQDLGGDLAVATEGDDFQSVTSTVEGNIPPNVADYVDNVDLTSVVDDTDHDLLHRWKAMGDSTWVGPIPRWEGNVKGKGKGFMKPKLIMYPTWGIEKWATHKQMVNTGIKLSGVMRHKAADYHIFSMREDDWCSWPELLSKCEFLHFRVYLNHWKESPRMLDDWFIRDMVNSTAAGRFEVWPTDYYPRI
jgi:hypothetical protein